MGIENYNEETVNYIYGDLNEQEMANFEEKLKLDPALAEEVARLKKIIGGVKLGVQLDDFLNDPGYMDAEIQAEEAVREYRERQRREYLLSKNFRRKILYPVAASLLALVYLGNIAIFMSSPDLAFQKYFRDYTPVYYAQATIDEAQLLFLQSTNEYEKGNYHAVAENMRILMEKGELNLRGHFMLGFYDGLKEFYETIWDKKFNPDDTEQEDAVWYLAITSFKLKNLPAAQTLFREISAESKRRGKKAARLERKISKILGSV